MTRIVVSIFLIILAGCTVDPKFQRQREAVEANRANREENEKAVEGMYRGETSTYELMRLGRIIQEYLGTPYGSSSAYRTGFDCSAFTCRIFDEFNNTQLPRTARDQAGVGVKVNRSSLSYGDLVFFKTDGRGISHVGIYVGFDEFVHSSSSQGVMISNLNEKYWKKRFLTARRVIP